MPDTFTSCPGRRFDLARPPAMFPQYLRAGLPRFGARPRSSPEIVLRLNGVRPDPERVARYAAVVGHPPSDRLPLLYPHLLGFGLHVKLMTDASFPFPPLGLVHIANEVTALRPLPLGAELDIAVHAGAVRPHPRGRVVDLITRVGSGGEPVWTGTSSYLRRQRTGAGRIPRPAGSGDVPTAVPVDDPAAVPTDDPTGPLAEGPAAVPTDDPTGPLAEGPAGEDLPLHFSARWELGGDLGRRYAAVSGDLNPLHLSGLTARPLGYPRAIAHGMWTAASVLGALEGRLPDALRYTVQFRRPITLPATVRLYTCVQGPRVVAQVRGGSDDSVHLVAQVHEV